MTEEIENIIKNIALKDVEIELLESELKGLPINKEEILIILKKLKQKYVTNK